MRQVARLLAGMLWVAIREKDLELEVARRTVRHAWRVTSGHELDQRQEDEVNADVWFVISCWKTAVWDMSHPDAVSDALLWWAQTPAAWAALEAPPPENDN